MTGSILSLATCIALAALVAACSNKDSCPSPAHAGESPTGSCSAAPDTTCVYPAGASSALRYVCWCASGQWNCRDFDDEGPPDSGTGPCPPSEPSNGSSCTSGGSCRYGGSGSSSNTEIDCMCGDGAWHCGTPQ